MTTLRDWSNGEYPWDIAKCGCCLTMHSDNPFNTHETCKYNDEHQIMRDVITEQGMGDFYIARIEDARNHGRYMDAPTPITDKWLTDNLEKAIAIRELFRDQYNHNPAPPEQMELSLGPVEGLADALYQG